MGTWMVRLTRVAAGAGIAFVVGAGCGGDDEKPPQEAGGAIASVATAIGPCVEDPEAAMSGVSVSQDADDPSAMVVTLADGAAFSVVEASPPEAANAEAESLLASCP